MKKLLIVSALATFSVSVFADETTTITAGANAIVTPIAAASPPAGAAGTCGLLSAAVNVNSSAGNDGSIVCNDTTASIGVAFGNINGKFNVYSAGSAGGGITTTPVANAAAIPAATDTQATTSAASS